jgi:hypothetical protein
MSMDLPYYERSKMKFTQEMLLFDGVLAIYKTENDNGGFGMQVLKMRANNHARGLMEYSVTSEGIKFK